MRTPLVARLALVNATGFSATTVMPLWLGRLAPDLDLPSWFASVAVLAQIGSAALLNLTTPWLFREARLVPLARAAALTAASSYLLASLHSSVFVLLGLMISGASLGVLLNVTNRIMGSSDHVQRGYAIFVIIEVLYAASLFLSCTVLISHFGLLSLFWATALVAFAAFLLLATVPIDRRLSSPADAAGGVNRSRPRLVLASFIFFFFGQAAINAFMPQIGVVAGLDPNRAAQLIGLGMPCGLIGALLARIVGERLRPLVAILGIDFVLACLGIYLTRSPTVADYVMGIVTLAVSTIFIVPYYFAQLGALDRSGRYASFGPAMMLLGIAGGPSVAMFLRSSYGLQTVGLFSALLLLLSGFNFLLAASSDPTRCSGHT